jgi:hypothetical protein
MHRYMIKLGVFAFLASIISLPAGFTVTTEVETGMWPKSWPKELEPLRNNARTYNVATALHEIIYEIHFQDRNVFERAWPLLLGLKSKGGTLTLCKVESTRPKQEVLFSNDVPSIRIHAPESGLVGNLVAGPPWPPTALLPNGELSEYVTSSEIHGEKTWVPVTIEKARNEMEKGHFMWLMRARVDLELIIDGKIIDLNRIRIPSDTPIIDKRWPAEESKIQTTK